jgi:hypothetical protein
MFLRTVERYPEFRFAVHFSGWLLDDLLTSATRMTWRCSRR